MPWRPAARRTHEYAIKGRSLHRTRNAGGFEQGITEGSRAILPVQANLNAATHCLHGQKVQQEHCLGNATCLAQRLVVPLLSVGDREDGNLNRQDAKAAKKTRKLGVLCAFAVKSLFRKPTNT